MAAQPSPIWKRTLVWLKYQTCVVKSKGKTCMVKEPSQIKQLFLIPVCKLGLTRKARIKLFNPLPQKLTKVFLRVKKLKNGLCFF
jgi:hypothetical protein